MNKIAVALIFLGAVAGDIWYVATTGHHNGWLVAAAVLSFLEII